MVPVTGCLRRNRLGGCRLCGRRLMCGGKVLLSGQAIVRSKQSTSLAGNWESIVTEGSVDQESCRLRVSDDLRGCWGGSGNLMDRVLAGRRDGSGGSMEVQIRGYGDLETSWTRLEVIRGRLRHRSTMQYCRVSRGVIQRRWLLE